jgi:urease accessory protein
VLPVGQRDPGSAAEVVVAAVADETGRTRYRTLRSSALLAVRPTIDGIHLLSATASPIGGDTIRVRLSVGPGAVVTVGSAAAAVARRGPDGSSSRQVVEARVARGGSLHWAPEPLVVAEGARHWSEVSVEVAAGGHLWWQETIVAGRTDEPSGWYHSRLRLDVGGWPALRHELTLGPGSGDCAGQAGARLGEEARDQVQPPGRVVLVEPAGAAELGEGEVERACRALARFRG